MLYHCMRRWRNIKTTDRRFAFAGITVILIIKSITLNTTTDHCEHARLVQWHPAARLALH